MCCLLGGLDKKNAFTWPANSPHVHASYINRSINMAWKETGVMDWSAPIWMLWVVMSLLTPWNIFTQTDMKFVGSTRVDSIWGRLDTKVLQRSTKDTLQGRSHEVTKYHMTLVHQISWPPNTCTTGVSKRVSIMVMSHDHHDVWQFDMPSIYGFWQEKGVLHGIKPPPWASIR